MSLCSDSDVLANIQQLSLKINVLICRIFCVVNTPTVVNFKHHLKKTGVRYIVVFFCISVSMLTDIIDVNKFKNM